MLRMLSTVRLPFLQSFILRRERTYDLEETQILSFARLKKTQIFVLLNTLRLTLCNLSLLRFSKLLTLEI